MWLELVRPDGSLTLKNDPGSAQIVARLLRGEGRHVLPRCARVQRPAARRTKGWARKKEAF